IDQMPGPYALARRDVARQRLVGRLREVIACAEAFAVALDDDGADRGIDVGLAQRIEKFAAKGVGESVSLVGPVERDTADAGFGIFDLDEPVVAHDDSSIGSAARPRSGSFYLAEPQIAHAASARAGTRSSSR